MRFYNRDKELEILEKIEKMSEQRGQMTTIIGRRRVGKTELIRHFLQKKTNSFYFFVEKKRKQPLLEEFTGILRQKYTFLTNPFKDWNSFFGFIFEMSKKEEMTVVFDEFQNFKFVDSSAFSTLQKIWDLNYKQSKLNLILVGSVITLMEKIFRGSKEPLFGRVDHKIYLEPFAPLVIQNLLGDYNIKKFDDFLNFYTVFGGIPKYYAELENKDQLKEKQFLKIVEEMFFAGDGVFKEEGFDLLSQEFGKDYQTYFSILQVIASGNTKSSEIADKTGIPVTAISRYLNTLVNKYRFIKTRSSIFSNPSKNNRYYLNDHFLIFWFRYIFRFKSLIEIEKYNKVLDFIKKDIGILQGFVFEELVYDFILNEDKNKRFPFQIEGVGNYWDKKGNEIDLVIFNKEQKKIMFIECKLSAKRINKEVVKNLKEKSKVVKWENSNRKEYFGICAMGEIDKKIKADLIKQGIIIYEF
ncbi:MAG: DUF234 domain-containing protein [bacterium]